MATAARKTRKRQAPSTTILGANVYRLRVLQIPKLSQEALATISGVSVETIRLVEQGRDPSKPQLSPHLETLDKIAAALGTDTATLLTATPSKPSGQRDHSQRHLRSVPEVGAALPK